MQHRAVERVAILLVLLLPGCLALPVPTTVREDATPSTAEALPIAIELVEEVPVHPGGGQAAYTPGEGEARQLVRALLGVFGELNLQALCFYLDDDVARMQAEQASLELILIQPMDMAIGQQVGAGERDQVPTDERGYRVLRVERAVYIVNGEMAGHVLVGAGPGEWSCWAVEKGGTIDLGWVERIEAAIPPPP